MILLLNGARPGVKSALAAPKNIKRAKVDAHFVLSFGAKVNNNKYRVIVVNTELDWGLQIDRYS